MEDGISRASVSRGKKSFCLCQRDFKNRSASRLFEEKPRARHVLFLRRASVVSQLLSYLLTRVRTGTHVCTRENTHTHTYSLASKNDATAFVFPRGLFARSLIIQVLLRCLLEQSNLEISSVNLS